MNIVDRQTFIFSVDLNALDPSQIITPINLRFAADELILKCISYNSANVDTADVVQIWCNITHDGLIGSFPNSGNLLNGADPIFQTFDSHFRLSNTFQTGNFILQFQTTNQGEPFYYNPQPLISTQNPAHTAGTVSMTIEFVKLAK
jgi:hypothetical protein